MEVAYSLAGPGGLASGLEESELNDVEHAAALIGAGDDSNRSEPHLLGHARRLNRGALGSIALPKRADLDGKAATSR